VQNIYIVHYFTRESLKNYILCLLTIENISIFGYTWTENKEKKERKNMMNRTKRGM